MVRGSERLRRALERKRGRAAGPDVDGPDAGPDPRPDSRPGPAPAPLDRGAVLRERMIRRAGRPGYVPSVAREPVALPEGDVVRNERGECYRVRQHYAVDYQHGGELLRCGRELDLETLAVVGKDPALASFDPRKALFLDTETTGLHGGAGTTVFMVGLGFYEGDQLVVEQVFLRDFSDEPAALQHVAQRVWEYPHLVTFVGKTFDRHRLATRMAVQKVRSPMLTAPHLDLYYAARRRYKGELPNCKLRTIEEQRLGVIRTDDLPGSEAPAAWLQWLRDGTGAVDRVFEHNHIDVLSLVTLLGVLGR